jgi:rRNA-processing protein FCF1
MQWRYNIDMTDVNSDIQDQNTDQSLPNDQIIYHALKTLDARTDELKEDIKNSATMLSLGVDTDLLVYIKKALQDPISQLLFAKDNIDATITSFVVLVLKKFFETHQDKISKVLRTETYNNDLHFSIILKDDTPSNRESIFSFLRDYKTTKLSDSFPIYFQFVPFTVAHTIQVKEVIIEST